MGIFSAAKALLTSDGVIEKGAKALDALHLSKEESAELDVKYIEAKAKLLESSTASALTRRILAVVISGYWLFANLLWLFLWCYLLFTEGDLDSLAALEEHKRDIVNPAFMLTVSFYFGVRALEKFKK